MSVKTLIEEASKVVGNRNKLAKILGVAPSQVYDWHEGRKPCSPADRARIAGFARQDAMQELVRATLENTEGTIRGNQLKQLLGKLLHQTGGALHTVLAGIFSLTLISNQGFFDVPRCILC